MKIFHYLEIHKNVNNALALIREKRKKKKSNCTFLYKCIEIYIKWGKKKNYFVCFRRYGLSKSDTSEQV